MATRGQRLSKFKEVAQNLYKKSRGMKLMGLTTHTLNDGKRKLNLWK